jgi:hypothetical protein
VSVPFRVSVQTDRLTDALVSHWCLSGSGHPRGGGCVTLDNFDSPCAFTSFFLPSPPWAPVRFLPFSCSVSHCVSPLSGYRSRDCGRQFTFSSYSSTDGVILEATLSVRIPCAPELVIERGDDNVLGDRVLPGESRRELKGSVAAEPVLPGQPVGSACVDSGGRRPGTTRRRRARVEVTRHSAIFPIVHDGLRNEPAAPRSDRTKRGERSPFRPRHRPERLQALQFRILVRGTVQRLQLRHRLSSIRFVSCGFRAAAWVRGALSRCAPVQLVSACLAPVVLDSRPG